MVNILGYVEKTTYELLREDIEALISENPGAVLVTAGVGLLAVVVYRATTSLSSSVQALRNDVDSLTESNERMGVAIEDARGSMAQGLHQIEERVQANIDVLVDRINQVDGNNGQVLNEIRNIQELLPTIGGSLVGVGNVVGDILTRITHVDNLVGRMGVAGEVIDNIRVAIADLANNVNRITENMEEFLEVAADRRVPLNPALQNLGAPCSSSSSSCQSVGAPVSSSSSSHQSAGGSSSSNLRPGFFSPPTIPGSGSDRSSVSAPNTPGSAISIDTPRANRIESLRDLPEVEHRSGLKSQVAASSSKKAAASSAKKRSRQDREQEEEDGSIAGRLDYHRGRDSFAGDEEDHHVRFNEDENTRHSGPRYSSEEDDDIVDDNVTIRSSQKRARVESEDENTSSDEESRKSPKKKPKPKPKGDNPDEDLNKYPDDEDHDGDTAGGGLGMTTNGLGMKRSTRLSQIPKASKNKESSNKVSSNKKTGDKHGINDDEEVYDDLMSVAETDSLDCNDISSDIDHSYEALTVVTAAVGLSVAVYNMDVDASLSMLSSSTEVIGEVSKSLADVLLEYAAVTA